VRKILPPPGFDSLTVQNAASRYTDYDIPADCYASAVHENWERHWSHFHSFSEQQVPYRITQNGTGHISILSVTTSAVPDNSERHWSHFHFFSDNKCRTGQLRTALVTFPFFQWKTSAVPDNSERHWSHFCSFSEQVPYRITQNGTCHISILSVNNIWTRCISVLSRRAGSTTRF
jgi:hypothetical protein